jgi:hypothetical protein
MLVPKKSALPINARIVNINQVLKHSAAAVADWNLRPFSSGAKQLRMAENADVWRIERKNMRLRHPLIQ